MCTLLVGDSVDLDAIFLITLVLDVQPLVTTPEITVQTDIGPGNYRIDVSDQQSVVSDCSLRQYLTHVCL